MARRHYDYTDPDEIDSRGPVEKVIDRVMMTDDGS